MRVRSSQNRQHLVVDLAVVLTLGAVLSWSFNNVYAQQQPQQQPAQPEETTADVPKPPKDDFTVRVYKTLDQKKQENLKFKDQYKADDGVHDVDIVITYYNWGINSDDYWNRQLNIETKTKEGATIEKIVKSGFGELGYVKEGDSKTQDVFRKEKLTVSGDVAIATMMDRDIGAAEKDRYRNLMEKFILSAK